MEMLHDELSWEVWGLQLIADHRVRFDALVEELIEGLPESLRVMLDRVPVIVLDEPEQSMLDELESEFGLRDSPDTLCGLHTGTALTERSVEHHADLPETIHLFRRGIVHMAGGWERPDAVGCIKEQIMITLLHEIGHHFGLDEQDLADLGYD